MDWKTYYNRFNDWAESTQLRHLSTLTNFGPPSEVCELACAFYEEKSANRFIKKALAAGICFTAEEVLELEGAVEKSLMLPLIMTVSSLKAEELDELSFWLTKEEVVTIAKKHHIQLDEYGYVMTPEDEALELEFKRAEKEGRREEKLLEKELVRTYAPRRKKRAKTQWKKLWISLRRLNRSTKKLLAGPPTTKQKIAQQRAKARRNRPWWDK